MQMSPLIYGKVTDHVSREIRLGKITRDEGLALVAKFQCIEPRHLNKFLEWANVSESFFNDCVELHADKNLSDSLLYKNMPLVNNVEIDFLNNTKRIEEKPNFVLMAKGWLSKWEN